jgi:hypothetical protein
VLSTIAVVLVLWLPGVVTGYTIGAFMSTSCWSSRSCCSSGR